MYVCSLGSSHVSLSQCALFKWDFKPQIHELKAFIADRWVTLHCSTLLWTTVRLVSAVLIRRKSCLPKCGICYPTCHTVTATMDVAVSIWRSCMQTFICTFARKSSFMCSSIKTCDGTEESNSTWSRAVSSLAALCPAPWPFSWQASLLCLRNSTCAGL